MKVVFLIFVILLNAQLSVGKVFSSAADKCDTSIRFDYVGNSDRQVKSILVTRHSSFHFNDSIDIVEVDNGIFQSIYNSLTHDSIYHNTHDRNTALRIVIIIQKDENVVGILTGRQATAYYRKLETTTFQYKLTNDFSNAPLLVRYLEQMIFTLREWYE